MIPQYMKTAKIILMTLCSLVVLSCAKNKRYSYQEYGLDCPVKSIKVTTYEASSKFGEVVKGDLKWNGHYLAEFNSVGNIITLTEYDNDGNLNSVTKCKYNEDDNVTDVSEYDEDGKLEYNQSYEYKGILLVKFTRTFKDTTEEVYVNEFFRDGETIIKETTHHNGELRSVVKYNKHDKTGTEWVRYDKDGKEQSRGSSILNEDGKVTRCNLNDKDYYEVTWNEKGLPVYLKNAELYNSSYVSSYNYCDGSIFYIEYEYDNKGNWIKQTLFEGELKKPVTISERVIVY